MKMIWAILTSETIQPVIDALRKAGIHGITRMNTVGYGREPELPPGQARHTQKSREMLMIVLADRFVAKAVIAIRTAVKATAKPDSTESLTEELIPDGKIFVTYVDDCYTVRTARKQDGTPEHEENYCDHPG